MAAMNRMSCEEAVRKFFAYLDRSLSADSAERLEAHLRECLDCCDRLEFLRKLEALVKTHLPEGALPPHVEARIRRRLAETAAAGTGEP